MKRKRFNRILKQMTAGLLAAAMSLSLFTGMSFTSYAVEGTGQEIEAGDGNQTLDEAQSGGEVNDKASDTNEAGSSDNTEKGDGEETENNNNDSPENNAGETEGNKDNEDSESESGTGETEDGEPGESEDGTGEDPDNEKDGAEDDENNEMEEGDKTEDGKTDAVEGEEEADKWGEADEEEAELLTELNYADFVEEITAEAGNGEWTETYERLVIKEYKLPDNGALTLEILQEVLQAYASSTGKKYQDIELQMRRTENNQINKDLYNACIPYLESKEHIEKTITYNFLYEHESYSPWEYEDTQWSFRNPRELGTDLNANIDVRESDSEFYLELPSGFDYSGCAENVSVYLGLVKRAELNNALKAKFGEGEVSLFLYDENGNELSSAYIASGAYIAVYGMGMLKDTRYVIDTWQMRPFNTGNDAAGTYLTIWQWAGMVYDAEHVKQVLEKFHKDEKYDNIYIHAFNTTIDAGIYNVALPYLKESGNLTYHCSPEGENEYYYDYQFIKPSSLTENVTPTVFLEAEGEKKNLSISGLSDFPAEKISVNIFPYDRERYKEIWKNAFGENWEAYSLFSEGDTHPLYNVNLSYFSGTDGQSPQLYISDIKNMEDGKTYSLATYVYRGDIFEDDNGRRNLHLSSKVIEQDKFNAKELVSVLKWYADKGEHFDHVTIEESYSSNNIINKDCFNQAAKLLTDGENSELTFTFCRCEDSGSTNDLNWHFRGGLTTASGNINANIVLTPEADYGVTVQLNAASYPAEYTEIQFYMKGGAELKGQLRAALGEPGRQEGENWTGSPLGVLKEGADLTNLDVSYGENVDEAGNGGTWFGISDVKEWTANQSAQYVITPILDGEELNVGAEYAFSDLAKMFSLPENAANLTWKTFTPDLLAIADGKVSVVDDRGEGNLLVIYKVGEKECMKLFRIPLVKRITRIVMDKTTLTMNLYKYDGEEEGREYWECEEGLSLKFYPAESGCDQENPDEVEWTSSAPDIVAIKQDEQGRFKGISALKPGTATITATYIKDFNESGGKIEKLTATCEVTVRAPQEISKFPGEDGELYAVMNFDTKLSDVALPAGWQWVNGETLLSTFKDMSGNAFPAVYTDEAGRTETYNLWVRMLTITGVRIGQITDSDELIEPVSSADKGDKTQTIIYDYGFEFRDDYEPGNEEWQAISDKWTKAGYKAEWTSNPKNLLKEVQDKADRRRLDVDSEMPAGKKTVTLTIRNAKGSKVFTASHSLTVTGQSLVEFPDSPIEVSGAYEDGIFKNVYDEEKRIGTLTITLPKEQYKKLTISSKDTALLKTGKPKVEEKTVDATAGDGEENVKTEVFVTTVDYTVKGYGVAPVEITAADELKSHCTLVFTFVDKTPKLLTPTVTLNRKLTDKSVSIGIQCENGYPATETAENKVGIAKNYANASEFALAYELDENGFVNNELKLSIKANSSIKNGSHKVPIQIPVKDGGTITLTVTVKIVSTLPSIQVKQTGKVNLFYTDEEGNGSLNITAKDAVITEAKLTECDYELIPSGDGNSSSEYAVRRKAGTDGKQKKGTLSYKLEGFDGEYTKKVTVSTVSKKPTVLLSRKSDTLYPKANYPSSTLILTDKGTGETIGWKDIKVKDNKDDKQFKSLSENNGVISLHIKGPKKNDYAICFNSDSESGRGRLNISLENMEPSSSTDKLSFKVQKQNWSSAIDVSYSVKVVTKDPKLKLSSSTVTLNKNEAIYEYQQVKTGLSLDGFGGLLNRDESEGGFCDIYFTGKDKASTDALKVKGNLVLQYWEEKGCVVARFNDNGLDKGAYKYNVCVDIRPYTDAPDNVIRLSAPLTIKVIDTASEKCISVSTKGSIDLLNREETGIAVTPRLSKVTGIAEDGELSGKDASLFESEFKDGKLYIRAREGETYSVKHTYKVKAVFRVQTEDYYSYRLESKELSIKVKQGKPKVKASSAAGNTLYRTTGNNIEINISAMLGGKDVEIEEVRLVNYTDDLELLPAKQGDGWIQNYNNERHSVRLTTTGRVKDILKNGKMWSVKFAVHYRDQAGDVKDTQVAYKVCVR